MEEQSIQAMVIKRDGSKEEFNPAKIEKAIIRAMKNTGITKTKLAALIASDSLDKFGKKSEIKIKDIENFIFKELNEYGQSLAANAYERYRATKEYQKKKNDIDDSISGLVGGTNAEVLYENSNKDSFTFSTQRDLIAGECSKAWASKNILPTDVLMAHEQGLIHYHDLDYALHRGMFNCVKSNMKVSFRMGDDDLEITTSVEEFDKRYLKLQIPSTIDGVLVELDQDVFIKDRNGVWTKILKIQKRIPTSDEFIYKIITATRKELEVTGKHIIPCQITREREEGDEPMPNPTVEIPASELKVGSWIYTDNNSMELVVRIDKYSPSGNFMVYDFETETHHFLCNEFWVHNCCLINLKDMLENGTVINKRLITGINSFSTACTVATQISLQCASHQYGGQTWSCSHLAPYVRKSRERWIKTLQEENEKDNLGLTEEQIKAQAETLLKKEIKDGCQTIQYQINTFSSTNGRL